jgi:cellulose synthase operon protein C
MEQWRPQEAAYAFDRALSLPGAKKDDAAYGKSLALLRGNATEAGAYAANEAALSPERRTTIGVEVLTQRAQAAYRAARYAEVLGALDQRAAFAPEQRDLMLLRGWSLYSLGHYDAAGRVFAAVDRQLSSEDSRKALFAVEKKLHPQNY